MRSSLPRAVLVGLVVTLGGAAACAHQPPPLPTAPPDVGGIVWTIRGSFEGGGTVVVRRLGIPGQSAAELDRLVIRPGARIVVLRKGRLRPANFSAVQLGQHVTAWWDGEPGTDGTAHVGPVRVLVIEADSAVAAPGA